MGDSVKKIAVLGSTGSIGRQTLEVVRALPDHFKIIALAAGNNTTLLAEQISEFKPEVVFCQGDKSPLEKTGIDYGFLPLEDIALLPDADIVVIATSGTAGLKATLAAAKAGKNIALANKESLVMAGQFIITEAQHSNAEILPIDSEHSAIWQCLRGETAPERIILTASGGPFRGYTRNQLEKVTADQALKHPSWQMGEKVTIDSATLMNKGLEIIEARWLFDMPVEKISVVIHPQSIIHSMVEFADGSTKAQLSYPDMRLPIQYALMYPERLPNENFSKMNWDNIRDFTFEKPDYDTFPCLKLAIEALRQGGTYPAALCAADEAAVELFLRNQIGFMDIPGLIEQVLDEHKSVTNPALDDILATDAQARERVIQMAGIAG
ncbi:MAG: 1-deoxy-D-xylulose-5-phosphate reductoisomerase [Dehalococcoidales bacterium]|nr:1-deoxy-D-xylulose-5-phosphate reductoisomerase [Dehalococcoidales bacterium]